MSNAPAIPIDVWLKFDPEQMEDEDDLATYEANTFDDADDGYRIEWYHNAVGLVTTVYLSTYGECLDWYERNGFEDFTA